MNIDYIYEKLSEVIDESNILKDEIMSKHTSFGIGGPADLFVIAKSVKEVKAVLELVKEEQIPLFVLGNGSNLLVSDLGIRGVVLKTSIDNIEIVRDGEFAEVTVGAGTKIMALAQRMLKEEITGLEFASGIPGTVGGAIRMNAGAYGSEIKDFLIDTTYMDLDGRIFKFDNAQHNFEYRKSIFSEKKAVILESKFRFRYGDEKEISNKMEEYKIARCEKQPVKMPSAGSTFKRGKDFITAKLIDECGLKGYKVGDAMVSDVHSGFIVNIGKATACDVLELIEYIKKEVYDKFQKEIELEVELVGEFK